MNEEFCFKNDDLFKRKIFADRLVEILNKSEEFRDESLVIALDSSWGAGKTTFIKKFHYEIRNSKEPKYTENSLIPFVFNAWEFDDWDNAFMPIAYCLYKEFESLVLEDKLTVEIKGQFKDIVYEMIKDVTKGYLKTKGVDDDILSTLGTLVGRSKDVILQASENDYFKFFEIMLEQKKQFKKILSDIINVMGTSSKLVIIIDELDRCRPTYAIETLEVIKHFFNVPNVVFILALDIEQLGHSVSTIYGNNMDSIGYLRRFMDIIVKLPAPEIDLYIRKSCNFNNEYIEILIDMFLFYNSSIRDIQKILIAIKLFYYSVYDKDFFSKDVFATYVYLIYLKYSNPTDYKIILGEPFSRSKERNVSNNSNFKLINHHSIPEEIWGLSILSLTGGRNLKKIKNLLKTDSEFNDAKLNNFIDVKEVFTERMNQLTVGQYIERKIELYTGV